LHKCGRKPHSVSKRIGTICVSTARRALVLQLIDDGLANPKWPDLAKPQAYYSKKPQGKRTTSRKSSKMLIGLEGAHLQ
jgi:hypothetical protein